MRGYRSRLSWLTRGSPKGDASGARREVERHRIHAVTKPGRARPIVEDVPEVRLAALAGHIGALHPEGVVAALQDIQTRDRLPEARPAGARIELGARVEQNRGAADAGVEAV